MAEGTHIPLSQDAALVTTLAGTAMPFSRSAEDQAERWLRALRLHGQVGSALQALGVGEAPLMSGSEADAESTSPAPLGEDATERIVELAEGFARERSAENVTTVDVLFALLDVYDRSLDRALYQRGATRMELLEKLTAMGEPAEAH